MKSDTGSFVRFAFAALAVLAAPAPLSARQQPKAEMIFVNGQIYTPSGWRSGMAMAGGAILATGSDAAIRKRAGAETRIVDLQGRAVLPGLYDMHVHPALQAKGGEGACRIPQEADGPRLLALLGDCVKAAEKGAWVTGGQWQASSLAGTPIVAQTLDAIAPDNPVMLFDVSGHSLWANSRALALAGIGRDTPNPQGGIIERDANGVPTGILRETARDLVLSKVPPQPAALTRRALKANMDMLLSYGIVGFVEAMALRDDLENYAALADAGQLKPRVQACIAYSEAGKINPELDATLADIGRFERPRFSPRCIKVFADGVPTESHTGAMLAPYQAGQPNAPAKGLLLFDPAVLHPQMAKWDRMGLSVLFHAAGDAAVRAGLDAIAYARAQNGPGGPIHQVGHSTFIDPADLPRARPLRAALEFSPYLWDPQPINDDITHAVGSPRIDRVWPINDGFASGALVIAGSDWMVIPAPDPWLGIETAITRRNVGGGERSFGLAQGITLDQALKMFTINAATRLGREKELGSLEPGKRADFILLDRNPFRVPATEIHKTQVLMTYIDGEKVYERSPSKEAK